MLTGVSYKNVAIFKLVNIRVYAANQGQFFKIWHRKQIPFMKYVETNYQK